MAVSFKVPSSPAKSIFTIDEFLGVDLTNSPANIQDNRSPNAPNMTRLVPGKVRKRMGYEKEVLFGTKTNVNWALGTSCEEETFELEANEWTTLYNLDTPSVTGTVTRYIEFDYKSDYPLYLSYDSVEPDLPASPFGFTHASLSYTDTYSSSTRFARQRVKSDEEQTIYIKNFAFLLDKNSSYVWSPRPKHFVETASNSEVFGFHKFITGNEDANISENVNRALGTTTPLSLSLTDVQTETNLYYLAETVKDGREVILKFDYSYTITTATLLPKIYIGNKLLVDFEDIGTETGHTYSGTFTSSPVKVTHADGYNYQKLTMESQAAMSLSISNLSFLYAKSEGYTWSAAPEDSGADNYPDFYVYDGTNYSETKYFSETKLAIGASTVTVEIPIQSTQVDKAKGNSRLSFEMYITCGTNVMTSSQVTFYYYNAKTGTEQSYASSDYYSTDVSVKYRSSLLLSPAFCLGSPSGSNWSEDNYFTKIVVSATVSESETVFVKAKNVLLERAEQKENLLTTKYLNLYHVGDKVFSYRSVNQEYEQIATGMNRNRSMSWQFGAKLFIIDGANSYLYNEIENTLETVGEDTAYIPLVTISKLPSGGGTSYEPLNLMQSGFYEQFTVDSDHATDKEFYLSFSDLDATTVKAWILDEDANWIEQFENVDFQVSRAEGWVHFITAPGETVPLTGEDNVKILAYRTVAGYANRIKKCRFGTLFGVNGASDRLFLSGNPDYPNYDWYSEQYDPTYFPDTGYSALGVEISAIVGYSLVNNYLATHKDDKEPSQSVFIREGDLIKRSITTSVGTSVEISEPAFKLINTLQGASALTPFTFGYLQTEPLFLTKSGIFALTTQDITGDKYGQDRSFYLNGSLMEENNLDTAYSCVFDNMYYLAVNTKVYLLDALQATRTDRSDPYSTRQYVGFVWNNIPATIIYTDDDYLWFGTADGKICRFYKDVDALESYNDDGYPIDAWWETPDLDGRLFYKNKTFRYYAARLMSALATSVKMWAMKSGAWTLIKTDNSTGRYFDFGNVNFEKFSFSTDQTEKVVHTKIKVKKVDKARFKLENDVLNEPFGLFNIALEYVENGNYKG